MSQSVEKVAIVTGANKGIGLAIVRGLCQKFTGIVYLTSRDESRGLQAIETLKKEGLNPVYHQLDITDQSSIEKLTNFIKNKHQGIDLLVNNAAIAFKHAATEPFGQQAKETVEINYFANLRLCDALFPLLRQNARVVNMSSVCGHLANIPGKGLREKFADSKLTIPELNKLMEQFVQDASANTHETNGWGDSAYVVSKVGLTALTIIQNKHFSEEKPNRNIAVNAVHPGYVDTDMTSHKGPLTVEQGAKAPLFLALDADESVRGKFVWFNSEIVDWYADEAPKVIT